MTKGPGAFDPAVSSPMYDREPLVTSLSVGSWSGCYIPHRLVRLPLSASRFEPPNRQAARCPSGMFGCCTEPFVCFFFRSGLVEHEQLSFFTNCLIKLKLQWSLGQQQNVFQPPEKKQDRRMWTPR